MNHILVGPRNQRAWAGVDKSGAWPWVYRTGHVCTLVLGWAHLSDEQDSKICLAADSMVWCLLCIGCVMD